MKKFYSQLFYFLIPIFIGSFFLDFFISMNLKKSNSFARGEYPVWNDILEGKINSDILIYGSSRALRHFNSSLITEKLQKPTYNIGIEGHHFWIQYLRHRMLLKHNNKPKLIILSLDDGTLYKSKELYNLEQFLPYILWNNDIIEFTKSYHGFNFYDFRIPIIRYFGKSSVLKKIIELFQSNRDIENSSRIRGYKPNDLTWNDDFDRINSQMNEYVITTDKLSNELFNRFILECINDRIKIVFVYSPTYIEAQKFIKNRSEIFSFYYFYSKKFNIPFFDFSNDSICNNKIFFYNSMHLNKKGAELFTNKLIDTLKKYNTLQD